MAAENAIFISYRRSDSNDVTGRICDRLKAHFGDAAVFIDYDDIPYGADFPDHLQQTVDGASVLLAVIGPTWLQVLKERMDKPKTDWVRSEVERALNKGISVIPVLVNGGKVPGNEDLPASLQALPRKNAPSVRAAKDFKNDMQQLIARLEEIVGVPSVESIAIEWSGERIEALQQALMSAYPAERTLQRFLRLKLDIRLNQYVGAGQPYPDAVFSLLEALEAEDGKLQQLIIQARRDRPANAKFRTLIESLPGEASAWS